MIERQRRDHELLAALQHGAIDTEALLNVGDHVAMSQHGPLGEAGGPAGVLQEGDVLVADLGFDVLQVAPLGEGLAHGAGMGQVVLGHQLLDVFDHEVDQGPLGQPQVVTHPGQDHVLDRGVIHHFFQGVGEVGNDDDGLGAGVFQLMLQLARGIEGVDVHHRHAGPQDAEYRDGVLQQVRHHHGHPVPLAELQLVLQVGGEGSGLLLQPAVGNGLPHVDEGGLIGELVHRLFKHLDQRAVLVWIDLGGHPFWITLQPDSFHELLLHNSHLCAHCVASVPVTSISISCFKFML